jgi:hypothetical protein
MQEEPGYTIPQDFEPHLEIEVTFMRPEEGGGPWVGFRRSEAGKWQPGFTPPFYYEGTFWIAFYVFSQDVIQPGDKVKALVCFINLETHEHHRQHLHPGKQIELRDGWSKTVARGEVTRMIGLAPLGTT